MSLSIFYHPEFLNHDTGINHPENHFRLTACINSLKKSSFSKYITWKKPQPAKEDEINWIHSKKHIQNLKNICNSGGGYLDPDTPVCSNSFNIALLAAGAWLDGVDEVINGNHAFILARPPGHHAEKNNAMGFCLFSNAALAATYALKQKHIKKVAIFDWDVHHGNGTQNIVSSNPQIAYSSIHEFPFYPGTGSQIEKGDYGNVMNVPISSNLNSTEYRKKFDEKIFPFLNNFKPDILIISSGFDAHKNDPLANINLEANDFSYMTKRCLEIQSHIMLGLEGGYDLVALKECTLAVVKELLLIN